MEGAEVARRLSWSPTKVSNIEAGRRGLSEVDAAMYLACCRAPGDDIERVLEFFHAQSEYWVQPHGARLADELLSVITLETTATSIESFELGRIPGLLQTEDYARAVISSGLSPKDGVEAKVRARKDRQVLLRREWPPQCTFYIHECALRTPVGSDAIMNDQLLHLVFASGRPHIGIRVVLMDAGPHPGLTGSFILMEYAEVVPVVYLENQVASLFLDREKAVDRYHDVLCTLAGLALGEAESRSWLAQRASDHDRPREGGDDHSSAEERPLA